MPEKMARSPLGSHLRLASVLQEGQKTPNIQARLAVIRGIPAQYATRLSHRCTGPGSVLTFSGSRPSEGWRNWGEVG